MTIRYILAGAALASATVIQSNPAKAQAEAPAVAVPSATLLAYSGTYTTDRGGEIFIKPTLDGSLTIELNSPALKMRAVSQTEFAVDEKRARVTFKTADGKVSGLTIKMGSRELHATRAK